MVEPIAIDAHLEKVKKRMKTETRKAKADNALFDLIDA